MNTKKLILAILALTALGAALALSGLLPDFVTALLFIAAGCTVAYYLSWSYIRSEVASELRLLVKAGQTLYVCATPSEVVSRLEVLAKHVTGADEVAFFPLEGQEEYNDIMPPEHSRQDKAAIALINTWVKEHKKTWPLEGEEGRELSLLLQPFNLPPLLAVPLPCNHEAAGVLYLWYQQPVRLKKKVQLVEELAAYAGQAMAQCRSRSKQQARDLDIITALSAAIDSLDPLFAGHSQRVAAVALLLGQKLGLTAEEMTALRYSSRLHDVGKILTLKAEGKDAPPGDEHPALGVQIMPGGEFFEPIKAAIGSHHERYNGQGFPLGLTRNDIPFLARIIAVADVYDALTRLCPPEERLNHVQAAEAVKKSTGTLFDPLVVVVFAEVESEIAALYEDD